MCGLGFGRGGWSVRIGPVGGLDGGWGGGTLVVVEVENGAMLSMILRRGGAAIAIYRFTDISTSALADRS